MVIAVRITMMVVATLARARVLRMIVDVRLARLGKGRLLEEVMHPVRRRGRQKDEENGNGSECQAGSNCMDDDSHYFPVNQFIWYRSVFNCQFYCHGFENFGFFTNLSSVRLLRNSTRSRTSLSLTWNPPIRALRSGLAGLPA
jgi:hypothetical protein